MVGCPLREIDFADRVTMAQDVESAVCQALDQFKIELPSWGFANTGSRFGKFMQPAAATNLAEKFSDAGMVNQLTGACPTVALHAIWDLPNGLKDVPQVEELARKCGVVAGSINPNVFQGQEYKFGAAGNPDPAIRKKALDHLLDCVAIADKAAFPRCGSVVSRWIKLPRNTKHASPHRLV
jgi:L-rhamnose isomerase/sugar isomerase